jgi:hypothetical protein
VPEQIWEKEPSERLGTKGDTSNTKIARPCSKLISLQQLTGVSTLGDTQTLRTGIDPGRGDNHDQQPWLREGQSITKRGGSTGGRRNREV